MRYPWHDVPFPDEDLANYERAGLGDPLEPGVAPAVVVVDMNRMFSDSAFAFGDSVAAEPAFAALEQILPVARQRSLPVVYTTTFSTPHRSVSGLWKGTKDVGSQPGAHDIPERIAPAPDEPVLAKSKPSAFWQTGLADILAYHRVDTLVVCGMVTSGCVRATVIDGFSHNLRVLIPADAVADRGSLTHKVNLFDMHMKYAEVVDLPTTLEYLRGC